MYEPYNVSRKIIGFDSFEGFPTVSPEDGSANVIEKGNLSVSEKYDQYLSSLLKAQEQLSPRAIFTVKSPGTIISQGQRHRA